MSGPGALYESSSRRTGRFRSNDEVRMITSGARFAFFALTALLLAGCAGKVRYPDYYMLALAPSKGPAAGNEGYKLPAVVVQRFETPAYLRQGRIVYRQTPEQIGFYEYHRWVSD